MKGIYIFTLIQQRYNINVSFRGILKRFFGRWSIFVIGTYYVMRARWRESWYGSFGALGILADGVIYKYIFNLLVLILFEWDLFRSLSEDVHHKSVEGGCLGYLLSSTDGVRLVQGDFDWFWRHLVIDWFAFSQSSLTDEWSTSLRRTQKTSWDTLRFNMVIGRLEGCGK